MASIACIALSQHPHLIEPDAATFLADTIDVG